MNIVICKLAEVLGVAREISKTTEIFSASPGLTIGLSTNFSQLGPARAIANI